MSSALASYDDALAEDRDHEAGRPPGRSAGPPGPGRTPPGPRSPVSAVRRVPARRKEKTSPSRSRAPPEEGRPDRGGTRARGPSQGSPPGSEGGQVLAAAIAALPATDMASGRRGPVPRIRPGRRRMRTAPRWPPRSRSAGSRAPSAPWRCSRAAASGGSGPHRGEALRDAGSDTRRTKAMTWAMPQHQRRPGGAGAGGGRPVTAS